jgi:aryl-alcohol dehydrogenase-like predicted oxidoreductase
MEYRNLGRSGLKVSPIALGTAMFGRDIDEAASDALIGMSYDEGVNFIDVADAYSDTLAELAVGKALAGKRHEWVLATKFGNPVGPSPNDFGASRRHMLWAVEGSLKRLRTDYIDVYYLHSEDHRTPLEETAMAFGDLIRQGKIRYFAVSNFRGWRIAELCNICDRLGMPRPVASEPYYNMLNRMPEVEHIPACEYYGVGVVAYSVLGRGVLTAKYGADGKTHPEGTRGARNELRLMQTEWRKESFEIAEIIRKHAASKGMTAGQFALNWVLNNRFVASALVGPRTTEQWAEVLKSLSFGFTSEDEKLVNSLVAAGHPSTPGYNDPKFPIEGRKTFTEPDISTTPKRQYSSTLTERTSKRA